jgi:hypothetical protein
MDLLSFLVVRWLLMLIVWLLLVMLSLLPLLLLMVLLLLPLLAVGWGTQLCFWLWVPDVVANLTTVTTTIAGDIGVVGDVVVVAVAAVVGAAAAAADVVADGVAAVVDVVDVAAAAAVDDVDSGAAVAAAVGSTTASAAVDCSNNPPLSRTEQPGKKPTSRRILIRCRRRTSRRLRSRGETKKDVLFYVMCVLNFESKLFANKELLLFLVVPWLSMLIVWLVLEVLLLLPLL